MKRYAGLNWPWCRIPFAWGYAFGFLGFTVWTVHGCETIWTMWKRARWEP